MKCPHCEYSNGVCFDDQVGYTDVVGTEGEFYELPIVLARYERTYDRETKALYGCPACNKTFIGD